MIVYLLLEKVKITFYLFFIYYVPLKSHTHKKLNKMEETYNGGRENIFSRRFYIKDLPTQ